MAASCMYCPHSPWDKDLRIKVGGLMRKSWWSRKENVLRALPAPAHLQSAKARRPAQGSQSSVAQATSSPPPRPLPRTARKPNTAPASRRPLPEARKRPFRQALPAHRDPPSGVHAPRFRVELVQAVDALEFGAVYLLVHPPAGAVRGRW